MDLVRNTVETLFTKYHNESNNQLKENFILKPPSAEDQIMIAPFFTGSGLSLPDAFTVLLNFDRDPKKLAPTDIEKRVKFLNLILKLMEDKNNINMLMGNMENLSADDKINAEGMINVIKRVTKLLIMEAKNINVKESLKSPVQDHFEYQSNKMQCYTQHLITIIMVIVILILSYKLHFLSK